MPDTVTFWNRLAARYDAQSARYMETAYPRTIEAARSAADRDALVLDIGCGTGIVTLGVATAAAQVLGIDVAPQMVEIARQKAAARRVDNVDFRVSDGSELPDASFDVVLICNVLLYVPDPAELLADANRLLKDDGVLVTVTDCLRERAGAAALLQRWGARALGALGAIPKMQMFRRTDIINLVRDAGFRIEDDGDFYPAPVNYYLRARQSYVNKRLTTP